MHGIYRSRKGVLEKMWESGDQHLKGIWIEDQYKSKTVYMEYNFGGRDQGLSNTLRVMAVSDDKGEQVGNLEKYLECFIQRNKGLMI